MYGETARKKAMKRLEKGYYSVTGTDLHSLRMLDSLMEGVKVKQSAFKKLTI